MMAARHAMVPEFAVVGHPNEGKSSVLSTLAEDDSVRISPVPGETRVAQRFPVIIDGREVICFTDTPGFQNPRRVLALLQGYGDQEEAAGRFIREHGKNHELRDDCELLAPLAAGAGIIYVVDGSRPPRNVDQAEMEILRLTGRPRMAIINCKEEQTAYLDQWRSGFRRSFNAVRVFNAHRATYRERIELLEALKHMEQDWLTPLDQVITAFRLDWQHRSTLVADALCTMLNHCLAFKLTAPPSAKEPDEAVRARLLVKYADHISQQERETHERIRRLYKHNIFQLSLPPQSILEQELFHEKTWQFLGLDRKQLLLAGTLSGAAVGAGVDLAAHGISFGVFSALGGLAGLATTAWKGREILGGKRLFGLRMDEEQIQVGPNTNVQFLFVLVDRALLIYEHVINWAHGRRGTPHEKFFPATAAEGAYTRRWSRGQRETGQRYFRDVLKQGFPAQANEQEFRRILAWQLEAISNQETRNP